MLCKPKDKAITEGKNNRVYEIKWSSSKPVYFVEYKWSLELRWNVKKDLPKIAIVKRMKL